MDPHSAMVQGPSYRKYDVEGHKRLCDKGVELLKQVKKHGSGAKAQEFSTHGAEYERRALDLFEKVPMGTRSVSVDIALFGSPSLPLEPCASGRMPGHACMFHP